MRHTIDDQHDHDAPPGPADRNDGEWVLDIRRTREGHATRIVVSTEHGHHTLTRHVRDGATDDTTVHRGASLDDLLREHTYVLEVGGDADVAIRTSGGITATDVTAWLRLLPVVEHEGCDWPHCEDDVLAPLDYPYDAELLHATVDEAVVVAVTAAGGERVPVLFDLSTESLLQQPLLEWSFHSEGWGTSFGGSHHVGRSGRSLVDHGQGDVDPGLHVRTIADGTDTTDVVLDWIVDHEVDVEAAFLLEPCPKQGRKAELRALLEACADLTYLWITEDLDHARLRELLAAASGEYRFVRDALADLSSDDGQRLLTGLEDAVEAQMFGVMRGVARGG